MDAPLILPVKYKIPSPREHYILREEAMNKLEEAISHKLTIVKAGAGSGKTTLLSILIKKKKLNHPTWITMDSGMNQVFLFWNYVFQGLKDEIEGQLDGMKESFEGSIQKEILENMLPIFACKLSQKEEHYLILDDFQYITDPYLLKTLQIFLHNIPDQMHVVILSRELPELPMGPMFMDGSLSVLSEEDLRISEEECQEFLSKTLKIDLDKGRLKQIVTDSNGWIGGAQLMAIAGKKQKKDSSIFTSADHQLVYDYIEREIFSDLTEEEQLFLMKTSILSYFNQNICERLLPEYNFVSMMQAITQKNLFVVVIDEQKLEYRYHSILREFLLNRIALQGKKCNTLYLKVADIMFEIHDYDSCVGLLFEIHDYERLMNKLLQMPQNVATFSYIMQVPMESIVTNLNFAFQYFFCYYASLEMDQCKQIYDFIKTHLNPEEFHMGFENISLFIDIGWSFDDVKILSLEQINSMPFNKVTKAYILIKEAYFLFLADKVQDAMSYLDHAHEAYKLTRNIFIESFILAEKTQILETYGEFREAFRYYDRLIRYIDEVPTMEGSYYIGIAGLYIRQMRLKEAKQALDHAAQGADMNADNISSAYLYTLAEWYYLTGHPEKTEKIIKTLAKDNLYYGIFFLSRLLRYPIYRGTYSELLSLFLENYKVAEPIMKNMDTLLLYIGILYEKGNIEDSAGMLDDLLSKARRIKNKVKLVECDLMKARMLYETGEWKDHGKEVCDLLLESLEYAIPEEMQEPFWFEKTALTRLMKEREKELKKCLTEAQYSFMQTAVNSGIERSSVQKGENETVEDAQLEDQLINVSGASNISNAANIVDATNFSDATNISSVYSAHSVNLTEREEEVLSQIATGKTNQEIADTLCISLATVKTHLINIYGKLGVNNRMAAVNKYNHFA